jgi:hypothetical protein
MSKVKSQISNYPSKRGTLNNGLQHQVGPNQQPNADTHSSQENLTLTFPPFAYYNTYTTVNISVLIYGLSTANLPLLYIACIMAAAPISPSVMKFLISLVKENFLLKGAGK